MAIQQFVNNFVTTVDAPFSAVSTSLQLASTAGLPVLNGGDYLFLTLYRLAGTIEKEHEVVKVTAINGNICTVVRSVEGAAASAFSMGDPVEARLTAKGILDKADIVNTQVLLDQKASIVYVDTQNALKAPLTGAGASGTWGISITGNAGTATKLAAARTINGVPFDGTANISLAKADIALGNVDNTSDVNKPVSTAVQTALNLKADITYVDNQVAGLVNSAPATLDTLNELAAALGNDANFATTTANSLGNRLRIDTAAQGLTGTQKTNAATNLGLAAVATSGLKADVGLGNVDNTSDVNKPVSTAQAAADALALPKTGGSMVGNITGADNKVIQMMLQDIGYTAVDNGNSGTATVTFDYTAGCKQKVTATGAHTFAFSNWPPTGNEGILRVDFFNYGAFAITPPTVTWTNPDGSETTSLSTHFTALAAVGGRSGFTAAGNTKAIFWSSDAGATVYGKFI